MQYHNPVIPGFYPDPSVCEAGGAFYLVTSSFGYFPGIPVFASTDLVNWKQIGHCLSRESQLVLSGEPVSGGIYAPTIRYHQGVFYVIVLHVGHKKYCYVTAPHPAGPWSDPVWVQMEYADPFSGSDPSLFFDRDGTAYLTHNQRGVIEQCVLDPSTGRALSESRPIWSGTGGQYPEGPHLYTKDGYYYLMIAEGGTEYGHMETIARSRTPWGPFEPCPYNPVLTHRSKRSAIQGVGHADLIQRADGSWWAVCLGVRPNGYPPCYHLGRETFLIPVSWGADDWPVFGNSGMVAELHEIDAPCSQTFPGAEGRDDFNGSALALSWVFLRNPIETAYSLTIRPGWLSLRGSAETLNGSGSPVFIGRRQQHFVCRASTLLDFCVRRDGDEAGITVFMNERHHYEIARTRIKGKYLVIVRRRIGDLQALTAQVTVQGSGPVELGVSAVRDRYSFFALIDGTEQVIDTGETRYLSTEVAGGFTGVMIGLYATGNGAPSATDAFFDWFLYQGSAG